MIYEKMSYPLMVLFSLSSFAISREEALPIAGNFFLTFIILLIRKTAKQKRSLVPRNHLHFSPIIVIKQYESVIVRKGKT